MRGATARGAAQGTTGSTGAPGGGASFTRNGGGGFDGQATLGGGGFDVQVAASTDTANRAPERNSLIRCPTAGLMHWRASLALAEAAARPRLAKKPA